MDRTSDDRRRYARGRHAAARGAGALAEDRGGLLQTGADRWRGPRQHARGDAPSRLDRVAALVQSHAGRGYQAAIEAKDEGGGEKVSLEMRGFKAEQDLIPHPSSLIPHPSSLFPH